LRVWVLEFRVDSSGFGVEGQGVGYRLWVLDFRVLGLGFWV